MKSIILLPHELKAALAGTLGQVWRPITRVTGIGAVTEFQKSDSRGYDWIMRDRRMLWNDLRNGDLLCRGPHQPGDVVAVKVRAVGVGMPSRYVIRSWLRVKGVAVRRVQDMTEEDAREWGLSHKLVPGWQYQGKQTAREMAEVTWNHNYARRGVRLESRYVRRGAGQEKRYIRRTFCWEDNPWCWVFTTEKAERTEE